MFENENSPLEKCLPAYLPGGYSRNDRSLWFNRTEIGLQAFYDDGKGHFIRLELSTAPIGNLMSMQTANPARRQVTIAGCRVGLDVIKQSGRAKNPSNPVVAATWEFGGVHFRLQSNGLAVEEVEKIIASTLS
jgi:hypothetical protein